MYVFEQGGELGLGLGTERVPLLADAPVDQHALGLVCELLHNRLSIGYCVRLHPGNRGEGLTNALLQNGRIFAADLNKRHALSRSCSAHAARDVDGARQMSSASVT